MPDTPSMPDLGQSVHGAVEILIDPRARESIDPGASLTRLTDGGVWAEGPVYLPWAATLMYSDVRMDRGMHWSEATGGVEWRQPNDHTNGNTLDREGRVIHCEHGNRRIARTELDGTRHGLVDRHDGKPLNSPNDVVVKSDGSIWFTDPPYGIVLEDEGHPAPQEQDGCYVFRFDPESGELTVVSDALVHPNGLAFSPDEARLYVSDTSAALDPAGNHHILEFDVIDGRRLERPRVFKVVEPGLADGLRVDENGDVWTSAEDGIHVVGVRRYRPGADPRARRSPSNCVFGGPDGRRLFITASSSLYSVETLVRGSGVAAKVTREVGVGLATGRPDR